MSLPSNSSTVWKSYLTAVLMAIGVALFIRGGLVEAYRIPTALMRPTLEPGDVIFASKPAFGFRLPGMSSPLFGGRMPDYGEVVVFSSTLTGVDSIRRVIALEGDTVEIRQGRVWVNSHELQFQPGPVSGCGMEVHPKGPRYGVCFENPAMDELSPEKVPPRHVFVLGDLRRQAPKGQGSAGFGRSWAMVPVDLVKAKALWVWLSIDPERSTVRRARLFKTIR